MIFSDVESLILSPKKYILMLINLYIKWGVGWVWGGGGEKEEEGILKWSLIMNAI